MLTPEQKKRASELYAHAKRLFTEHPRQAGETYPAHWWFTVRLSARVFFCGICIFIHGIFPFLLTRAGSSQMARIQAILEARVHALDARNARDA